jgi:hypothetical protein
MESLKMPKPKSRKMTKTNIAPLPGAPDVVWSYTDETPSSSQKAHRTHSDLPWFRTQEGISHKKPTSNMSELIDEDIVDRCTRAPTAVQESSRPLDLANLGLVYSNSSEVKEIARWI